MDAPPVQYAKTSDGYNIAYAVSGEGLPFVFMPQVRSHVQLAWTPGTYLHKWLVALRERFLLVQYDGRGQGMSTRGVGAGYSLRALEVDLEAVVDRLQLERFVLMGGNFSGHAAIRFAVKHPHRVEALILPCCSLAGRAWPVINALDLAANWQLFPGVFMAAMQAPTPALRQLEINHFRESVTQEDWLTMARVWASSDISEELYRLKTRTLVLHPRGYENMPTERSIEATSRISDARLVLIDGVLENGDADSGIPVIESFLAERPGGWTAGKPEGPRTEGLSQREVEVLHLIAAGRSNQQIADELVISLNTVRRHVSNIFDKTGVANRAQAAVYAKDHGIA